MGTLRAAPALPVRTGGKPIAKESDAGRAVELLTQTPDGREPLLCLGERSKAPPPRGSLLQAPDNLSLFYCGLALAGGPATWSTQFSRGGR